MGLTLGSLFSGSGGFELAGVMNGITPVWSSEIEPYPLRVTAARFPTVKQLGDVTKINGSRVEPVDIITFGSPCLPAGTPVSTKTGYKNIEDVTVFDEVLTHTGEYRHVTCSGYTGHKPIWELRAMGAVIRATQDHKFYVRTMKRVWVNERRSYIRTFSDPKFVPLGELTKKDYICIPVLQTSENPYKVTETECTLIGRYIADGYLRQNQRPNRPLGSKFHVITFCIGHSKINAFETILRGLYKYGKCAEVGNCVKFTICDKRLEQLCESCGKGAENKVLPQWVLNLPCDLLKKVIEGYMAGDGCITNNVHKLSTVSRNLALSMGCAVAKVYHRPYQFYQVKVPPTKEIEGRTINQRYQYMVVWKTEKGKQDKAFYENGYLWCPVQAVYPLHYSDAVYDLSVEEDHSFCACNAVVHNCQDLSIAGRQEGITGSRSSLFFEAVRIIKEMRDATNGEYPKYAVWENVFGALSSNGGRDFQAVLQTLSDIKGEGHTIPQPDKWDKSGYIVGEDYSIAWRLYDAQFWGVPQRRKRIYLIADFGGQRAGEILFKPESMYWYPETCRETWQGITGNTSACVGETGNCLTPWDCQSKRVFTPDGPFHTLYAAECGGLDMRSVIVLNDQGGSQMDVSTDKTGTLRAQEHGHQPNVCYRISSYHSNSMLSKNPHSGIYQTDKANTLDVNPDPSCNQGGTVVVGCDFQSCVATGDKAHALQCKSDIQHNPSVLMSAGFNTGDSASTRSIGYGEEVSPTLRTGAGATPGVLVLDYHPQDSRIGIKKEEICQTLAGNMGMGGNNVPLVLSCGNGQMHNIAMSDKANTLDTMHDQQMVLVDKAYALQGSMVGRDDKNGPQGSGVKEGVSFTLNTTDHHVVAFQDNCNYIVRRLTPLECCRLQGFPDGWMDGVEGSDSAKYKMWGNGVALPCVYDVMQRIVDYNDI